MRRLDWLASIRNRRWIQWPLRSSRDRASRRTRSSRPLLAVEGALEQRQMLTVYTMPDSYTLQQQSTPGPNDFDVLANDYSMGGALTIDSVSSAAHGSVLIVNTGGPWPVLRYTPYSGYVGGDSITYVAKNTSGGQSTGTVSVTIQAANQAPTIQNLGLVVDTGTPGDKITTDPRITGTLTDPDGGGYYYVAEIDWNGDGQADDSVSVSAGASFTYDLTGHVAPGSVTAKVRGVQSGMSNTLTGAWSTLSFTYEQGSSGAPTIENLGLVNDNGTAGDKITTDPRITGKLTDPNGGGYYYTAEIDWNDDGMADDTVSVSAGSSFQYDLTGNLSPGEHTVKVRGIEQGMSGSIAGAWSSLAFRYNADPQFGYSPYEFTLPAGAAPGTSVGFLDAWDADSGDQVTFSGPSGSAPFSINPLTGEVTFIGTNPVGGTTYSLTFTASDGLGGSGTASVTVHVESSNQSPTFSPASYSFSLPANAATGTSVGTLFASDPDAGDSLTFSGPFEFGPPFAIHQTTGVLSFTGTGLTAGDTFSLTFEVTDSAGAADTASVTITIAAVNQPPVAVDDSSKTSQGASLVIDVLANDNDPEGGSLTIASVGEPGHGTAVISNGKIQYVPDAGFAGTDVFTYVVEDGEGATATASVTVTVAPTNPIAVNDKVTLSEGLLTKINVLANDLIPEGRTVSVSLSGSPSHGAATVVDNTIEYTPSSGYVGADALTYTLTDDQGQTSTATVSLTVVANSAPVVLSEEYSVYSGESRRFALLANDSDPDGDALSIVSATVSRFGTVQIHPPEIGGVAEVSYVAPSWFFGTETITYVVSDGKGRTATGTVELTVTQRPLPVLSNFALYVDTRNPFDSVTEDARVTGIVTSTRPPDLLAVQFDVNGDSIVDLTVPVAPNGSFLADLGPLLSLDKNALVSGRAVEQAAGGTVIAAGNWNFLWFKYISAPPELPEADPGSASLLTLGLVTNTTSTLTVGGTVDNVNGGALPQVQIDIDGDLVSDLQVAVDGNGAFLADLSTQVGYLDRTVSFRTADTDGSKQLYGKWESLSFFRAPPPNDAPTLTNPALVLDTDTAGDGITSDVRISGTATNPDGNLSAVIIEYDADEDGVADHHFTPTYDANGNFEIDLNPLFTADGPAVIRVRARETDDNTQSFLYGDWSQLQIEYTGFSALRPAVTNLALANDTGTAGDKVTSDPRITGTVNGALQDFAWIEIEVDLGGNGSVDTVLSVDDLTNGNFTADLTNLGLDSGTSKVSLRAVGRHSGKEVVLQGDWNSFEFAYEPPPPPAITVTGIGLVDDTGTAGDFITADPRIQGTATLGDRPLYRAAVEYDLNADGVADGQLTTKASGAFVFDPRNADLPSGKSEIRLRAGVWDDERLAHTFGDWTSITIDYQPEESENDAPTVSTLVLFADHDGDGTVNHPILHGTVSNDGTLAGLPIQYDLNNDGTPEGTIRSDLGGGGEFILDLSTLITTEGSHTVRVRVGESTGEGGNEVYGEWTSLTFTYEEPTAGEEPGTDLEPSNPVPVGPGLLTAGTTYAHGTVSPAFSYGAVVGAETYSSLLATPGGYDLYGSLFTAGANVPADGTPVTTVYTTSYGSVTYTTTHLQANVSLANGQWYYYDEVVVTYVESVFWTDTNGDTYSRTASGGYGYTFEQYGYDGNSVSFHHSWSTDSFTTVFIPFAAPADSYTVSGGHGWDYWHDTLVKVNSNGLGPSGVISGTITVALNPLVNGISFSAWGNGSVDDREYLAGGTTNYNADYTINWTQENELLTISPSGGTATISGGYLSTWEKIDPFHIVSPVNTSQTYTSGDTTITRTVNETSTLIGLDTVSYVWSGTSLTDAAGTSTTSHNEHHRTYNETYTYSGTRGTIVTTSGPGYSSTFNSSITGSGNRTRNYFLHQISDTSVAVDKTVTASGTINGSNTVTYGSTSTGTSSGSGSSSIGGTTLSFSLSTTTTVSASGNSTNTIIGSFGTAGTLLTQTVMESSTRTVSVPNSTSQSQSLTVHDDGQGNNGFSKAGSNSSGSSTSTTVTSINAVQIEFNGKITSTGTLSQTETSSGSSSFGQTNSYGNNSKSTGPNGELSEGSSSGSSYYNSASTSSGSHVGTGVLLNGDISYSATFSSSESGTYSLGNGGKNRSYQWRPEANATHESESKAWSQYDESGTFSSSVSGNTTDDTTSSTSSASKNADSITWSSGSQGFSEDWTWYTAPAPGNYSNWSHQRADTSSFDSGSGNSSATAKSASTSGPGGSSSSGSSTYSQTGSGSNGSTFITLSEGGSSSSAPNKTFNYSKTTVSVIGTGTYSNSAFGKDAYGPGGSTSEDTAIGGSTGLSTRTVTFHSEYDNANTATAGLSQTSKGNSDSTSTVITDSKGGSFSFTQRFADGTNYSLSTGSSSAKSTGTFSRTSHGEYLTTFSGYKGINGTSKGSNDSNRSGTTSGNDSSSSSTEVFPDKTTVTIGESASDFTSKAKGGSSSESHVDTTDTSKPNITVKRKSDNTNSRTNIVEDEFSGRYSKTGVPGWTEETFSYDADVITTSFSSTKVEQDAKNYQEQIATSDSNGHEHTDGKSRTDSFPNGTSSFESKYNESNSGTRNSGNTSTSKVDSATTEHGVTTTRNGGSTDGDYQTNVKYGSGYSRHEVRPVGSWNPTVTIIESDSESGSTSWLSISNMTVTVIGVNNDTSSPNLAMKFNNTNTSVSNAGGNGSFNSGGGYTTVITHGPTGETRSTTGGSGGGSNDTSTWSRVTTSTTNMSMNRVLGGNIVGFSVVGSSNETGFGSDSVNDSHSSTTDAQGTKSTSTNAVTNSTATGTSTSSSTTVETVEVLGLGPNVDRKVVTTTVESSNGFGTSTASGSRTVDIDYDGKSKTSGGGTGTSSGNSKSENTKKSITTNNYPGKSWTRIDTQIIESKTDGSGSGNASVAYQPDGKEVWSGGGKTESSDYKKEYTRVDQGGTETTTYTENGFNVTYTNVAAADFDERSEETWDPSASTYVIEADGNTKSTGVAHSIGYEHKSVGREEHGTGSIQTWAYVKTSPVNWTINRDKKITGESSSGGGKKSTVTVYFGGATDKETSHLGAGSKSTYSDKTVTKFDDGTSNSHRTEIYESESEYERWYNKTASFDAQGNQTSLTYSWTVETKSKLVESEHYKGHFESTGTPATEWADGREFTGTSDTKGDYDLFEEYKENRKGESKLQDDGAGGLTGTSTEKAERSLKIVNTWTGYEHKFDGTDSWDGSTLNYTETGSASQNFDAKVTVEVTATYNVDPLGNVTYVSPWDPTVTKEMTGSTTSTSSLSGSATIVKYEMEFSWNDVDGDGEFDPDEYVMNWKSKSFSVGKTWGYNSVTTLADGTQGTWSESGTADTEEFWSFHMYPLMYMTGWDQPTDFVNQVPIVYPYTPAFSASALNLEAWELVTVDFVINSPLAQLIPGVGLIQSLYHLGEGLEQLYFWYMDGTLVDFGAGVIDGFLNTINPFDHWWSFPDIGSQYGHADAYGYGQMAGMAIGIGVDIALSIFGPGLVSCGSWGHKLMLGWELAGAIGGIGAGVQGVMEDGKLDLMDALSIGGGLMSMGGMKSAMNRCFVAGTPVGVGYGHVDIVVATTGDDQQDRQAVKLGWCTIGVSLLVIPIALTMADPSRRKTTSLLSHRRGGPRRNRSFDDSGDVDMLDDPFHDPPSRDPYDPDRTDSTSPPRVGSPQAPLNFGPDFTEPPVSPGDRMPISNSPSPVRSFGPPGDRDDSFSAPKSDFGDSGAPDRAGINDSRSESGGKPVGLSKSQRGWIMAGVWLLCLVLSGFSFWKANLPGAAGSGLPLATAAALLPQESPGIPSPLELESTWSLLTRPIEEIRPGMRVIAENPELEFDEPLPDTEIDPATWRLISFRREEEHGRFEAERLFPVAWIEERRIQIGSEVELDLSEIELHGLVAVTGIGPCPELEPDDGTGRRVVTAVYRHVADHVIDVQIEGRAKPIGCTDNHPFWSEDRQQFVEAGLLEVGEQVLADDGTPRRIARITPRRGPPVTVYNLEVDVEHVYTVGEDGILVHNSCTGVHSKALGIDLEDAGFARPAGGYQAAHIVPTSGFSRRSQDVQDAIRTAQQKMDDFLPGQRDKAINGFWAMAGHAGTHTDEYFLALGKAFDAVDSPKAAKAALDLMWKRIKRGDFVQ